jgi:hypothetical protein
MPLFITSKTTANRHAVYAMQVPVPALVVPAGTGVVGLVGQFPWGPDGTEIIPTDAADRANILAPAGMDRTGSGWLAIAKKAWPDLRITRVLGSAAAAAEVDLPESGAEPNDIINVTLKYKGAAGNDVEWSVEAASDGDSNHFNLRVFVTGASGTTEDLIENLNYSGTGDDSTPDLSRCYLIGSITKLAAGRPENGTGSFAGGADGTINAARYTGTAGSGDYGIAVFESDPEVEIIFTDDPGNTDRATVNAALVAHAAAMGDRIAVCKGNAGLSAADARAAANSLSSEWAAYADGWVYMRDEVDGTEHRVGSDSLLASVMAQIPPSERLETPRGNATGLQTKAGICTLIKELNGGYTWEAGVTTVAPADPAKALITRTRLGIYIARSLTRSLRTYVDGPSTPLRRQEVVNVVQRFMDTMVAARDTNPIGLPYVIAYEIGDIEAVNPANDIANGDFTVPIRVTTDAGMQRIFLAMEFGPTVTVRLAA